MFTLKLYRYYPDRDKPGTPIGAWSTELREVQRVQSTKIAPNTLEIRAIEQSGHYECFYIGERTPEMDAITDDNHFDWGLLENRDGKTTEHFRPHSYG